MSTQTTLEERQRRFDQNEYFMFDRVTGQRYSQFMTRAEFEKFREKRDAERN